MTTRIKRVVTTINDAGHAVADAFSEVLINGQWYPLDPVTLDTGGPGWAEWQQKFSAAVINERDLLLIDKRELESQLATITAARNSLQAEVDRTADRDELDSRLSAANASIAIYENRISALEAQLDTLLNPPGPDLTTIQGVKAFVSSQRYAREIGGIWMEGQSISTARDETGHWFPRFYNALMYQNGDPIVRASNPEGVYPYKPKNGEPVMLTAVQVLRAYQCMAWYINACFASEKQLYAQLDARVPLADVVMATEADESWPQNQFKWEPPQ